MITPSVYCGSIHTIKQVIQKSVKVTEEVIMMKLVTEDISDYGNKWSLKE